MFDAVRSWARARSAVVQVPAAVPYPPALHERMGHTHARLTEALHQVRESHRRSDFEERATELRRFERALRAYLELEHAQFEEYLLYRLGDQPACVLTMRQVRARLRQLAREAHEMLRPPTSEQPVPTQNIDLGWSFDIMSAILAECLGLIERDLLPRCLPEQAANSDPARAAAVLEGAA